MSIPPPDYTNPRVAKAIHKAQRPWYQKKRFLIPLVLVAGVFVISVISSVADPAPTAPTRAIPTGQVTASAPTPQQETPAEPSGPLTTIEPGTYEVGNGSGQVAPGKYASPNPDKYCYSARLKNNDGATGDIIANDIYQGQALLTVKPTDGYVEVTGCTFTKQG